jgi:cellulose synthase/poly-beta-1,6-N-acetylglucosamine synthase-like glycosyltransferase
MIPTKLTPIKKKHLKVTIGIFAHNEEKNIRSTLDSIEKQVLDLAIIEEILVVSSGSNDKTNELVVQKSQLNPKIKLYTQAERHGKSAAINLFLSHAKSPIVVTVSADLRLNKKAIEEIVIPFLQPDVGMVGAHPVPTNSTRTPMGRVVHVLWELHHEISLVKPKCGEMIAFRNIIRQIPPQSAVDEATLEVLLQLIGYSTVYAPRSIVYNSGPKTVADFFKQRRRVFAGHQWIKNQYNYQVVTLDSTLIVQIIMRQLFVYPDKIVPLIMLVALEVSSRILGWIDFHVLRKNPYVWQMVRR